MIGWETYDADREELKCEVELAQATVEVKLAQLECDRMGRGRGGAEDEFSCT